MDKNKFYEFLDENAEWKLGVDVNLQGPKSGVPDEPPENPYPIISKLKTVAKTCEWCNNICYKPKHFKKSLSTGLWSAHCPDCKQIRKFNAGLF